MVLPAPAERKNASASKVDVGFPTWRTVYGPSGQSDSVHYLLMAVPPSIGAHRRFRSGMFHGPAGDKRVGLVGRSCRGAKIQATCHNRSVQLAAYRMSSVASLRFSFVLMFVR